MDTILEQQALSTGDGEQAQAPTLVFTSEEFQE